MSDVPAYLEVHDAIMAILQGGMNDQLARFGEAALPDAAFVPVVQGDPIQDTICAAYSGARREPEQSAFRDSEVIYTINIWAFGADDDAAQSRAIALEAAAIAVLDDRENRYLAGACSQPISLGDTRCATAEDQQSPNLMWHLGFPVLCPVRTSRPE